MKPSLFSAGLCLVALLSCRQEKEIKVYRVAKDAAATTSQPADPHAGMPGLPPAGSAADPHAGIPGLPPVGSSGDPHAGVPGMGGAAAGGDPHAGLNMGRMAAVGSRPKVSVEDAAPSAWMRRDATALRQLSYQLHGEEGTMADISLIILRGAAGRDLDNINRWRDEQGLPPVEASALKEIAQIFTTPAGEAVAVDIEGLPEGADPKTNGRLLGAIVTRGSDAWFFRMRGNAELAAANKNAFIDWVKSVKPGEDSAQAVPDTAEKKPAQSGGTDEPCCPTDDKTAKHADHTPAVAAASNGGSDGRVTWQAPAGWQNDPTASTMRYATLMVPGADGAKAELAITHFPGDVGGDLQNVNRWRSQIGMPAVTDAELAGLVSQITAGPKTFSLVEFAQNDKRVAAAWTRHGADTWFFKFSGPFALVGEELEKFTALVESIRFAASGD